MMNAPTPFLGLTALWGVHVLSVILFFVGIIFLVIWSVKALSQAELKAWGIGLVVFGTVACLLTIGARGSLWMGGDMGTAGMNMMRMQMMGGGMDQDSGTSMMNHREMQNDAMEMSMDDMTAMLNGKTGDAFDAAFIQGMIPHHQGAIEMATLAKQYAKHDEIKRMADDIISAQQREIDQMHQWQSTWGYTQ